MLEFGRHLYAFLLIITAFRLLIRTAWINAVLGSLIGQHEGVITEHEILRLLPYIQEPDITQRLVYLTPGAVIVVVDGIRLGSRYLITLTLLVLSCDIGVQRLQVQILAQLRSDLVSQHIQLGLRKLSGLPVLYRYHILRLHLLHLRLWPGAHRFLSQEMGSKLGCDPLDGLCEGQMLLTLHQLNGRISLGITSTLILDKPYTLLLENGTGRITVILTDLEVLTSTGEAGRCLRIIMHDDGFSALSGQKYIILLNHISRSS